MLKHINPLYSSISYFLLIFPFREKGHLLCYINRIRDVYLAYLIKGAKRTEFDEYPVLEKWMVSNKPPKEIIQWNRRQDVKIPENTTMCFYCDDYALNPILNNPKAYIEKLRSY